MNIYIGADHAGFARKEEIQKFLTEQGHTVVDMGNTVYEKSDDYPQYAAAVAHAVADQDEAMGVLVCDSGVGVCIAANRFAGVRAVQGWSSEIARGARQHNNANIICLSAEYTGMEETKGILTTFLKTSFSQEPRHMRRVRQIDKATE
jgi:ribose 5-phosphate isomerase B